MKAMVLHGAGRPLRLEDVPIPRPGPNDVLVRVRACGVGLTVVKNVATHGKGRFPRIPGHEIAGQVVEVGAEVRTVTVGQRVTCHYYLTCGQCTFCRGGRESLCIRPGGHIGSACDGGYAEYVALPERNIIPIPDGVPDLDAALASDAIATPYHACHKEARLGPGDNVLVIGAGGGVGIHMVQMARLCGARVLAADIGDVKLELARSVGAEEVIDARAGTLVQRVKALTDGRGVDAVIDLVGSRRTHEDALASLAVAGRLVFVGHRSKELYGEDPSFQLDPSAFSGRSLELHSSRYVNASEIARTLEILRYGRVKAIVTRVFPLEEAEEAHALIRANATAGRLALLVDSS